MLTFSFILFDVYWATSCHHFPMFCCLQKNFESIMNRDIPWPNMPEEMSIEACDLIASKIYKRDSYNICLLKLQCHF
ncbi:hypothetical protein CICLE_v10017365mg [Citrus x clementina]|uniref:Uncharacterized protein n=1 Tax=Citrus clementina TaxID=85681 RepID=V4U9L6_CITCL|nr:hypothetical protein CICLE_v10017365mg [Citrus x clementina]